MLGMHFALSGANELDHCCIAGEEQAFRPGADQP